MDSLAGQRRAPEPSVRASGVERILPRGPGSKLRVWVTFGDAAKIGAGRAALLGAIDELGSIKAAAERYGMSYRYAWGISGN